MEFTCEFLSGAPVLRATAAFVQTAHVNGRGAGTTHGSTTCSAWSKETLQKLDELRASLEKDIAQRHFQNVSASSGIEGPAGIGENLDEDTGQQI